MHTDAVADAVVRVLEARAPGAFNLAAEPAVTARDVAAVLELGAVDLTDRRRGDRLGVELGEDGRQLALEL